MLHLLEPSVFSSLAGWVTFISSWTHLLHLNTLPSCSSEASSSQSSPISKISLAEMGSAEFRRVVLT